MTEAFAARAELSPAGSRPRVSAAAFRSLTERLKKTSSLPEIPDFSPVLAPPPIPVMPIPASVLAQPLPVPPEPQELPQVFAQNVAPFEAPVLRPSSFELPEFVPLQFEPPAAAEPQPPPVDEPPPLPEEEDLSPAPALAAGFAPATKLELQAVSAPEPVWQSEPEPVAEFVPQSAEVSVPEPEPSPEPQPESVQAAASEAAFAPPEETALQVELQPELAVEAQLQPEAAIVAEEQPQPEKSPEESKAVPPHAPPTPAHDASEAARKEHLTRKEALELDYVWRALLANPTIEERASFVREIAELLAGEGQKLPAPAPEHDLSTIAPANHDTVAIEPAAQPIAPAPDNAAAIVTDLSADTVQNSDNAELARSLLDMMASGSASGLPHERALAADTLLRLVPKLGVKPLIMMAQRLAKADNPPAMLVAKLIRDPRVEISGPLLEDCPQITDKDLETVVSEGSAAKLRMLARRRHLTAAISDALIRTHDSSVLLTLVRNMDATISQDGFQALIKAAEQDGELQAPLCTRPDFPAPLAFELFWAAPPQLRRYILSRFLTDSETLSKILKITLSTNDSEEMEHEDANSQHMLMEALERAARGKLEVAAEEFGQVLQITPATATRILHDAEGEPLMVLLKVAGYPRQALGGLLRRFREAELPVLSSGRDADDLQSVFDTLSFNKARILLTYWDWAQRKTGPYAPLH